MNIEHFRKQVIDEGRRLYRDLPWRRTRDPYIIWLSEVMLQQTQVARVEERMPAWLERFPSLEALAAADTPDVLEAWQGMGYNRRALSLHKTAKIISGERGGVFPKDARDLVALPGIGPATAQGIRSFAFDLPGIYLETNVRAVFLHSFFPDAPAVPDRELAPLVEAACPWGSDDVDADGVFAQPLDADDTPRSWYYALLDLGAHLKKTIPNPSRRSAGYTRQSRFEGSRRQKRAEIVRMLLDSRSAGGEGLTIGEIGEGIDGFERAHGRSPVDRALVENILRALASEGFCVHSDGRWAIASPGSR